MNADEDQSVRLLQPRQLALIDHDGGRFTYTYDAVNRIQSVENPQSERTSYVYDPTGRRTVKELANGTRASFSYDPALITTSLGRNYDWSR